MTELVEAELPRAVKVVSSCHGQLTPDLLLGFQAAVEENLDSRPSHHDFEEEHDHDDDITSTHLIFDRPFHPEALRQRLEAIVQEQEVYRIKGFVSVPQKPMRLVVQGVGTRFDQFYDRPWQPDESRQTRLVFIGRALNSAQIESHLAALPH